MGRPTKRTAERQERLLQALRAGNYREASARAAGISPATLYNWLRRGAAESSGVYREFLEAVERAEAEAEVYAVAVIRKAMPDDWRAAATFLERRYLRWRRRSSTELTGKDGGPIETRGEQRIDLSALSDAELAILERLHADTDRGRD